MPPPGDRRLIGLGVGLDRVNPAGEGNGPVAGITRPFDMTVLNFWIYQSFG
jgi:hypothetical protein